MLTFLRQLIVHHVIFNRVYYSPILHCWAGFQFRNHCYWKTGNQNHPDLEVRVVLVVCISNIDFFVRLEPADNVTMVNMHRRGSV